MTDFKPGDRVQVRGALHFHDAVVIAARGSAVWVEYPDNDTDLLHISEVVRKSEHPIPSEPNTAWVDRYGVAWVVSHGGKLTPTGNRLLRGTPEHYAPFTRLVPEGSEREAAIREVVEWLNLQGDTAYSAWVADHFLSGSDQ